MDILFHFFVDGRSRKCYRKYVQRISPNSLQAVYTMKPEPFFEKIRKLEKLTPSEARIASHMEHVYPLLGLETISTICESAQVGRATVVRFIQRLGYESYSHFQRELRSRLLVRLQSPQEKFHQHKASLSGSQPNVFRMHCDQVIRNINAANEHIDYRQLHKAARLMADCKGKVYIMGHRSSFALASFFHFEMDYMRDGIVLCNNAGGLLSNAVSHISKTDILFAFFKSRYSRLTEQVAHWFASHGSDIILVTDREANPLSNVATFQFVAPAEGIGIFDSRGATFAVLETIISLVSIALEDHLDERFDRFEKAINTFGIFSDWWKNTSGKKKPKASRRTRKKQ
jgi:DNA-binding MurR/RpiR family transcriptional regulator